MRVRIRLALQDIDMHDKYVHIVDMDVYTDDKMPSNKRRTKWEATQQRNEVRLNEAGQVGVSPSSSKEWDGCNK